METVKDINDNNVELSDSVISQYRNGLRNIADLIKHGVDVDHPESDYEYIIRNMTPTPAPVVSPALEPPLPPSPVLIILGNKYYSNYARDEKPFTPVFTYELVSIIISKLIGNEPVKMVDDKSSYDDFIRAGWTNEQLVNEGLATWNNPTVATANVKSKSATDLLSDCTAIQNERAVEYKAGGERSFNSVSTAFNAITGKDITPAEMALILQILKDVRQWSKDRLHPDSVLDSVSYASLKGEELYKQYGGS